MNSKIFLQFLQHNGFSAVNTNTDPLRELLMCRNSPIGILFSGGIDSVLITALAIQAHPEKEFDLINVAFEHENSHGVPSFETPDRRSCIEAFEELRGFGGRLKLIFADITHNEVSKAKENRHISKLIYPMNSVLDDSIGFALWFAARAEGRDFHSKQPYQSACKVRDISIFSHLQNDLILLFTKS